MSNPEMSTLLEISEGRLTEILRLETDNVRLRERVAELEGKIREAAFNCPSSGDHSYGLLAPAIQLRRRNELLLEAVRWCLENGALATRAAGWFGCPVSGQMELRECPPHLAPLIAEAVKP